MSRAGVVNSATVVKMNAELIGAGLVSQKIREGVLIKLYGAASVARAIGSVKLKPEFVGRLECFLAANRDRNGYARALVTTSPNSKASFQTIAAYHGKVAKVAKARSIRWVDNVPRGENGVPVAA